MWKKWASTFDRASPLKSFPFSANSLTILSLTKITYPTCTSSCAAVSAVILCQAALHCLHHDGSTEMTATAVATRHSAPPPPPYIAAALGRFCLWQEASGCLGRRGGGERRRGWRRAGWRPVVPTRILKFWTPLTFSRITWDEVVVVKERNIPTSPIF